MFKRAFLPLVLGLLCASCQKILDQYHHHDQTPASCQITGIFTNSNGFIDSSRIAYNNAGYPVSITYDSYDVAFDIFHSHVFNYSYDDRNRLMAQTSEWVYSQDQVYYAYEGNAKRPVRDTIPRIFGQVVVEDFDYDASGRIIQVVNRTVSQWEDDPTEYPTTTLRYTYDAQDNRQEDPSNPDYPGVIQYSDKPSLYSLHPVWQIIHKDYSRNSVLYADAYNDKGLPVSISTSPVAYFQPFLNLLPGAHVEYLCE